MKCQIDECDRESVSSGHCGVHRNRIFKTGSPYRHCAECNKRLPEDGGRYRRCEECKANNVCTVEGCGRPNAAFKMCKMHWKRWKKYGDPLGKSDWKPTKNKCSIERCTRSYHANGYCSFHGYRHTKYGDPMAEGAGKYTGRKRLDIPSYDGMHKRLFYDKGKASAHSCVDCGNRADEWSYDGGAPNEYVNEVNGSTLFYSTNQEFYSPRCKRCHRIMDLSGARNRDMEGRFYSTHEIYFQRIDHWNATKNYATDDSPPGVELRVFHE